MRPVFPQPGFTEADAHDLLATKQFIFVDCFTISMKDGSVLRYSTAQQNVTVVPVTAVGGDTSKVTFTSRSVKVSGLKAKASVGVEVDEQDLTFSYSYKDLYLNQPFASAMRRGRFDGATIRRDRYFATNWGIWVFGTPMFVGRTSTMDSVGRTTATVKVKSDLVQLNISMPRKVFQPSCTRTLFDVDCTLNRNDFQSSGNLDAGSTESVLKWSGANDGFKYGTVHLIDIESVTQIRTIADIQGDSIILVYPLDFIPSAGTSFLIYPGCIRSFARCGEFNNQEHFQAFEFVPTAETAQ